MSKFTRFPYTLIANQPTSSNYSSSAYPFINIDVAAFQIDYTGSSAVGSAGTFAVQGSVNYTQDTLGNVITQGTFANLPFLLNGSSTVASVAIPQQPSPIIFDLNGTGVSAAKVIYQGATSGFFT